MFSELCLCAKPTNCFICVCMKMGNRQESQSEHLAVSNPLCERVSKAFRISDGEYSVIEDRKDRHDIARPLGAGKEARLRNRDVWVDARGLSGIERVSTGEGKSVQLTFPDQPVILGLGGEQPGPFAVARH